MEYDVSAIIKAYKSGQSMHSIAKENHTYTATIKRILEKNNVDLRHDIVKKGVTTLQDGEKLIEWAKTQGRLVSKKELAQLIGKTRLSDSYFVKYPELGQYVEPNVQKDLQEYVQKLYNWLIENDIPYKPSDKKRLKVSVDALLLGEYDGLALQLHEKPIYVSNKTHYERMLLKSNKAYEAGVTLLFLTKEHFENLDDLKPILEAHKKLKEK